ncbi:MAG: ABC transporter substrate-binding protein [Acidobacteria bacterium]|nr:ABC transporter substrate-binding protein [Acidobacteriota bacterium]
MLTLAIPDMVSPSYFPAVAAVELGFFKAEGLDVGLELLFPIDAAYRALREGAIDFVGGSAHAALSAFPEWEGVKLLCAQSQGMYWYLVMRNELGARGDLAAVKGRSIGASSWVEMGLRALLEDAGIDIQRDQVRIGPVPRRPDERNFGVAAAKRLQEGAIDGFWANGMAAELAVRRGFGTVVLDARRDTTGEAHGYTFPALAASDRLIAGAPETAAAAVRAVVAAQRALVERPDRATEVGQRLFPPDEAALIAELVRRDGPYYDAAIAPQTVAAMSRFARRMGILQRDVPYESVVAAQFAPLWAVA